MTRSRPSETTFTVRPAGRLNGWPSRVALTALVAIGLAAGLSAQSAAPKPAAPTPPRPATRPAAASGVDTVIELVKGGMSEARVISTLKAEGKAYKLSTADLLKLQKAGVSEGIIDVMTHPGGADSTPAAAMVGPATRTGGGRAVPEPSGAATPFPPDLPDVPALRKRMLAVKPFDYSTVTTWVNYWFNNNTNIGEGIRAMLTVRLQQSKNITLLERTNIKDVLGEQDFAASNRVKKGTGAKTGQITGADVMLYGDIVIFGRDDTTKRKGIGAVVGQFSPIAGAAVTMKKEEKAVVGINLRLVDTETGQVIETAEARGESSRKSNDYGALVGVKGTVAAGASGMTSSNFQQTIIGEATSNAVTKIVDFLEGRIPQLPAKPRDIEGRIATVTTNGAYLTVGGDDGVMRGDRFEILKINGEIKNPVTKEVIDVDAVKVGELVVEVVRGNSASGQYGGQPLSSTYATSDKGYVARLMTK